jgi:beta-lactamase class A
MSLALLVAGVIASPATIDLPRLEKQLDTLCQRFRGRAGYYLKRLDTGQVIAHRADERFPTASTIKTAVALHVVREVEAGRRKWSDKIPLPPTDKRVPYDVSAWSYYLKDGTTLDLDGYVNLTLTVSDNLTTRVLREHFGTVAINQTLDAIGVPEMRLLASAPPEETRLRRLGGQFGMGMTTPRAMGALMEKIYRGQAAGPAGTEKMIRILSHAYWDDWIGASVPPGIVCASKSGAISRSRSDTAIVYAPRPYVLIIFTDNQKDRRWESDNEGDVLIRRVANLVWNALHPERPYEPPKGYERFLPTGGGVENT